MPIYEFECGACGHVYERLQKLSDPDPAVCPACDREAVKRRLSAPSFRLAGGGWYETDFKGERDRKRNLAGGDEAPKPAGGETAAKPAEAKPAETRPAAPASSSSAPAAST